MSQPGFELIFAVRLRFIARYGGQFLLIIAVLNLATLAVALLYRETAIAASYAAIIVMLAGCGLLLSRTRAPGRMQMNEALVLAALVFLVAPVFAALPLVFAGIPPSTRFLRPSLRRLPPASAPWGRSNSDPQPSDLPEPGCNGTGGWGSSCFPWPCW